MMQAVDRLMRAAVSEGVFPGGVLLVSKNSRVMFHEAYGRTDLFSKQPVTRDTVFDLASLTKPLATSLVVMRLEEQGRLTLDQPVGEILDGFQQTEKFGITIRQLLNHTSGLPDYRPYYRKLRQIPRDRRKKVQRALLVQERLTAPIGQRTLYSDIGFMILNWVIEAVSGRRLDHLLKDEITGPLGIRKLFFIDRHAGDFNAEIHACVFAATEDCPWRKRVIVGEVHDDNAYVMGGIDGHAGLFGTAAEISRLLTELQQIYRGHLAQSVLQTQTIQTYLAWTQSDTRALGFDTPSPDNPSCGQYFSPKTVGHLGFTGTSFWMDLEKEVHVILLSNRIHPTRENAGIREFRPRVHDMVMKNI